MCGITGFLWRGSIGASPEACAASMADAIAHRGPDSHGVWADRGAGIAFGHRRLAIVDLSPAGHQPMASPSGRYVLCYNGEIYNHTDLRAELEAASAMPAWHGTSDTETLATAFDTWGIRATLARAAGMFAIAVWDKRTRTLILARDRFGEKPLYYGWQERDGHRAFLFGSELRALRRHPAFAGEIAREELVHYARHGYVRGGHSIFRGIRQVRPGEILTLAAEADAPQSETYWDAATQALHGATETPFRGSDADALAELETLADRAVRRQMMSDVPLGAFLSGGIDSSTVVALMQRHATQPVHTFSIGFHEARYDEAAHARAVAEALGTVHTDLYVGADELLAVVPKLPEIYDEPFADSSQIPTFLVSQLARRDVTVALSGDGGDELFGGYDRYAKGARLYHAMSIVPAPIRRAGAGVLGALPRGVLDTVLGPVRRVPQGKEPNGQWALRMLDYAASADIDALHLKLAAQTREAAALVASGSDAPYALRGASPRGDGLTPAQRMMQLDTVSYLPGYILTKVDRASMAVSLESRAPLLDPSIAEFAFSLPEPMKLRGGVSKWLLRELCYSLVPRALVDRPKMGFEVPTGLWLRGPLKDWAGDTLAPDRIRADGWFDADAVTRLWNEHRSGTCNHGLGLWQILMFQAWHTAWQEPVAPAP